MLEYVCGFLFDDSLSNAALIRKVKPEWQRGLLNGIGGKVEFNETPRDAMVREFFEETGLNVPVWESRGSLICFHPGPIHTVYYFKAVTTISRLLTINEHMCENGEEIIVHNVSNLSVLGCIPNLRFIIPMILNKELAYFRLQDDEPGTRWKDQIIPNQY